MGITSAACLGFFFFPDFIYDLAALVAG
jgi:hypothetical protein